MILLAAIALTVLWDASPEPAHIVEGLEVRCNYDSPGVLHEVPDGLGGTRPDCWASHSAETRAGSYGVQAPLPGEIVQTAAWCVRAKDAAGNVSAAGCEP